MHALKIINTIVDEHASIFILYSKRQKYGKLPFVRNKKKV